MGNDGLLSGETVSYGFPLVLEIFSKSSIPTGYLAAELLPERTSIRQSVQLTTMGTCLYVSENEPGSDTEKW